MTEEATYQDDPAQQDKDDLKLLYKMAAINTGQAMFDGLVLYFWWILAPVWASYMVMTISTVISFFLWTSSLKGIKSEMSREKFREKAEMVGRIVVGFGSVAFLANAVGANFFASPTPDGLALAILPFALKNGLPVMEILISSLNRVFSGYSLDNYIQGKLATIREIEKANRPQ